MRRRFMAARAAVALGIGTAVLPAPAPGAVRVDQDEVIFSLRAPDASTVYLVGDFNLWNPTVEPMSRVDDRFEIGLFLVAGTYRYKFVVDGEVIVDPDNPGSPEQGSPLSLVERSGGLILSTELPEDEGAGARADFGVRYIGRYTGESGETDGAQRVDGFVTARLDRLRARAAVATHDSSWTWSPAAIDAYFERGFVEAEMGKLAVRGFENDSTWTSSDPMRLVGDAGVYGYDAGFRRHGVSAVARASKGGMRAFYADEITRHPAAPAPAPDLGAFAGGTRADTTAYAMTPSFDGSDFGAVEVEADFGAMAAGYTLRDERGANPGTVVDASRTGTGFATTVYATREDRTASALWLSYDVMGGVRATGAYGWGSMKARAYAAESASGPVPETQFSGTGAATDATFPIAQSDRGLLSLATTRAGAGASLGWDHTRFDFDGVAGAARAEVDRATVRGFAGWRRWDFSATAEYTRARYGDAPDALHIDWPEQNLWLSLWDTFDPERLAAAGLDTYSIFRLGAASDGDRIDADVTLACVTREVARSLAQASARARVEWSIAGSWRAGADARIAGYDGGDDFASFYVEAGWRSRRLEANAGFGFDPFVFDPVISDYADIGREEALREALAGGFARSRAGTIAGALQAREQALADVRLIKVEFVVRLP